MQNILPSIHLLEIFMPVADREDFLVGMLEEVKNIDFTRELNCRLFPEGEYRQGEADCPGKELPGYRVGIA